MARERKYIQLCNQGTRDGKQINASTAVIKPAKCARREFISVRQSDPLDDLTCNNRDSYLISTDFLEGPVDVQQGHVVSFT